VGGLNSLFGAAEQTFDGGSHPQQQFSLQPDLHLVTTHSSSKNASPALKTRKSKKAQFYLNFSIFSNYSPNNI
jgi:hypothetical protein